MLFKAKILEQEQVIRLNADIADQLQMQQALNAQQETQKRKLQKELETASDYILALEDKVYRANKTSLELLRQLKDAEIEIETLKNYIIELKQRIAVYIPVKDDAIDKRLAEFINNYPDRQKLKIMFLRESEGVYQFGSKRVAVRVDKDKINSKNAVLLCSSSGRRLPVDRRVPGPVHPCGAGQDGAERPPQEVQREGGHPKDHRRQGDQGELPHQRQFPLQRVSAELPHKKTAVIFFLI